MRQSDVSNFSYRLARVGRNTIASRNGNSRQENRYEQKPMIKSTKNSMYSDSLQNFQMQIDSMMRSKLKQSRVNHKKKYSQGNRRNRTQDIPAIQNDSRQLQSLKGQLESVRKLIEKEQQAKIGVQSKFQQLLMQMALRNQEDESRQHRRREPPIQLPPIQPQIIYPPQPQYPQYPPYPFYPPERQRRLTYSQDQQQQPQQKAVKRRFNFKKPKVSQNQHKRKKDVAQRLRKIFYVVTFTTFIKGETKKLSKVRRSNLRTFWLQRFESQVNCLKNFFLEANKYTFSIILEKKNLEFSFEDQVRSKVKKQKMKLLMQILEISTKQLLKQSTNQKISTFSEALQTLCRRGSFMISRFWTAYEMEMICVSEYYGFMRIDEHSEKCLIIIFVLIKVLIFNMLLQPHKFDPTNFHKNEQPLYRNMHLFASLYYHISRNAISEYVTQRSTENHYQYGNWLQVRKQFIVECTEPMIYGDNLLEDEQYISGLVSWETVKELKAQFSDEWQQCKQMIKQSIEKMHSTMQGKSILMKKNLKYKIYH